MSSYTCVASSRVGTTMRAFTPGSGSSPSRWTTGMPNPKVLPVPVFAWPITSWPGSEMGIVCSWMGKASSMPLPESCSTMSGSTERSENNVMWLHCLSRRCGAPEDARRPPALTSTPLSLLPQARCPDPMPGPSPAYPGAVVNWMWWRRRRPVRKLRLRSRGDHGDAIRVDFSELVPDVEVFLGQAAYLQLGYFETLTRLIRRTPDLHEKEALS